MWPGSARASRAGDGASPPRSFASESLFHILGDRSKLLKRCFQVFDDIGGNNFGRGEIGAVFE